MYTPTRVSQSLNVQVSNLPTTRTIISDFYIERKHFLVLLLDALPVEQRQQFSLDHPFLGQFLAEGKHYVIIQDTAIQDTAIQDTAIPDTAIPGTDDHHDAETFDFSPFTLLTERELQIATLVASGWSNKQIAPYLGISQWTVSAHLRRIFIKLNVNSRAAMIYQCATLIKQCHAD